MDATLACLCLGVLLRCSLWALVMWAVFYRHLPSSVAFCGLSGGPRSIPKTSASTPATRSGASSRRGASVAASRADTPVDVSTRRSTLSAHRTPYAHPLPRAPGSHSSRTRQAATALSLARLRFLSSGSLCQCYLRRCTGAQQFHTIPRSMDRRHSTLSACVCVCVCVYVSALCNLSLLGGLGGLHGGSTANRPKPLTTSLLSYAKSCGHPGYTSCSLDKKCFCKAADGSYKVVVSAHHLSPANQCRAHQ